jgi:hypothetical protein
MLRTRLAAVVGAAALLLTSAGLEAEPSQSIETFTCFAVGLGTGSANVIDITINRWSTDEERDMLLTTLQESGQEKLLGALEKIRPPVGYMRTPNSVGYELYYARNTPQPDGSRKVVLATNRWVSFREVSNETRSMQYQFTVIEIHLDKNNKGEGKLVPAARVMWDAKNKKIEIENYNAFPVDLTNVTAKTP